MSSEMMNMNIRNEAWHCYSTGPIDNFWNHLHTVDETIEILSKDDGPHCKNPDVVMILDGIYEAEIAAISVGWSEYERFSEKPRVFWLPGVNFQFEFGFVWKQSDNGITFIISPFDLEWICEPDGYIEYFYFDRAEYWKGFDARFKELMMPVLVCKESFVYFIEAVGLGKIKIGVSRNPQKRLVELSTGSPVPLKLLATIPGDVRREKELHAKFGHARVDGEWFYATSELRAWLAEIAESDKYA